MMSPMGLGVVALLVVAMTHLIYRWRNPKCPAGGVLPPGSMGLPLIGETIQLIIPSYSLDVSPFIKKRLTKYGPVFRTSVAGRPMVISADAEVNHFILQQEGKSVESWYLDLFAKLFKQGDARPDGAYVHKYVRHLALGHFGMESLKGKLLAQLEQMVDRTLTNWASQGSVEIKHASAAMALEFGARQLFSFDPEKSDLNLTDSFVNFSKGLMTFPINIPGTAYHKCLQDYEKAKEMMLGVVKERQASGETKGDVLDHALADMKVEKFLTEDFLAQMMFGLLFVTFDSISSTMTMAFKLLSENPSVLHDLTNEHKALLKRRKDPNSPLTWEEYKSMTFTLYVINETLRLGSVAPGLMRRAKKDIQVKGGYTIPAGWGIMVLSSALQLNPNTFEDPLAFNPWRWKGMSTSVVSKNFMPFGSGMKQCAGAEYSRVLLSTFLHVLVTKFKWNKIEGGDIVRTPILRFTNGLRIKVSKMTDSESEVAA